MTDTAKHALCYIAVGLITHKLPKSIYDQAAHRPFTFQGSVGPAGIQLVAVEDHATVTGQFMNGKWSIDLLHSHERFELQTVANNFSIYDFGTRAHYRGFVRSTQVSLTAELGNEEVTYAYVPAP